MAFKYASAVYCKRDYKITFYMLCNNICILKKQRGVILFRYCQYTMQIMVN